MLNLFAHAGHHHDASGVSAFAFVAFLAAAVIAMFAVTLYANKKRSKK